jgi:hypothetical protein
VYGESASLDFNTEPPSTLNNRITHNYSDYCWNSATISDSNGELLYYFSGLSIYDKDFNIIENGDSLYGFTYQKQTSIFLPGDSDLIYLFHGQIAIHGEPPKEIGNLGLYYSVIDKNKNIVIEKNKLIDSGAFYSLIAMPHENNKDFWIISRKYIDTFLIIHFNGDGIVKTKKQTFNKPYTPFYASKGYFENWTRLSQSNSGKYFLESFHIENFLSDSLGYPGFYLFVSYVNIFDFDNSRGEITNKNILVKHFTNDIKERRNIFNAAFSPNDSVIYVLYSGINVRELQPIKQFFYNGTSFIYNTEIINNFSIDGLLMDIKLAPNGKIYLSCNQRPYVAEIPYPNKLGKSFDFYPKKIKVSKNDESVSTALPNTYFQYINLNLKHKGVAALIIL